MSGGGSSGGTGSTRTTTSLPAWEQPYAKQFLGQVSGQVMPGGQLANMPGGVEQQVAPFSNAQQAGLQLGQNETGSAQGLADLGANANSLYASGAMLNPSSNPYLQSYYNAAALPMTQQFEFATDPSLMAQAQQAGVLDSSGFQQEQGLAQSALAQGLGNLGANIYEPAYQQGTQEQLGAAQNTGQQISNLYAPSQQLYNVGSTQQQQLQNTMNAQTANAGQAANWPFNLLSQLGGALGQASGGGGVTVAQGPSGGGSIGK